jgi:hypothetical protein
MDLQESFHEGKTLSLIGRYATPLAIGLILGGILFAPLDPTRRHISLALLLVSAFLNLFFVRLIARFSLQTRASLAKVRATANLWINIALVYMMSPVWPPIWLLLSLSSVATAIYGTRERTMVTAVFLAVVLTVINLCHGLNTPFDWALVVVKAGFIFLTSLMINDVVRSHQISR